MQADLSKNQLQIIMRCWYSLGRTGLLRPSINKADEPDPFKRLGLFLCIHMWAVSIGLMASNTRNSRNCRASSSDQLTRFTIESCIQFNDVYRSYVGRLSVSLSSARQQCSTHSQRTSELSASSCIVDAIVVFIVVLFSCLFVCDKRVSEHKVTECWQCPSSL